MVLSKNEAAPEMQLKTQNKIVEWTGKYKYLGTCLGEQGDRSRVIKVKTEMAWHSLLVMKKAIHNKNLKQTLRICISQCYYSWFYFMDGILDVSTEDSTRHRSTEMAMSCLYCTKKSGLRCSTCL